MRTQITFRLLNVKLSSRELFLLVSLERFDYPSTQLATPFSV